MLSFAKSVSRLVLCLTLWVGQNSVPRVHPWRARAESSITFLQRIILSRVNWEKLWKPLHTDRRKHKFIISREEENYYHPSEWWRRQEKSLNTVTLWVLALSSLARYWFTGLAFKYNLIHWSSQYNGLHLQWSRGHQVEVAFYIRSKHM